MKHYFKVMNPDGRLEMEYRDQLDAVKHAQEIRGYITVRNVMLRDCREYAYTAPTGQRS